MRQEAIQCGHGRGHDGRPPCTVVQKYKARCLCSCCNGRSWYVDFVMSNSSEWQLCKAMPMLLLHVVNCAGGVDHTTAGVASFAVETTGRELIKRQVRTDEMVCLQGTYSISVSGQNVIGYTFSGHYSPIIPIVSKEIPTYHGLN